LTAASWFEYGPTTNLGSVTTIESLGAGYSPVDLVADVDGLGIGNRFTTVG